MLQKFRFFIIIFILVFIFFPGFARLQELKSKLEDTERQIRKVKSDNALLEEKIARMKNQDYLEIVAREKMGVVRKGETVIKILREGEQVPAALKVTAGNDTRQ